MTRPLDVISLIIATVSGLAVAAVLWPTKRNGRSVQSVSATESTTGPATGSRVVGSGSSIPALGTLVVVGLFGLVVGVVCSSPTLALMPVPVASFAVLIRRRSKRRAARSAKTEALSAFVDAVGIELRSGASLQGAIMSAASGPQVGALAAEFDALRSAVEAGSTLDVALASLGRSSALAELSLLATTAAVLAEHGGPVAPAMDRLSELIRSGQANDRAVRSQASQATASASVMAGLPVVFGSVLALIDNRLAVFYLRSPLGAACVAACFVLVALGWVWMDRLIWSDG